MVLFLLAIAPALRVAAWAVPRGAWVAPGIYLSVIPAAAVLVFLFLGFAWARWVTVGWFVFFAASLVVFGFGELPGGLVTVPIALAMLGVASVLVLPASVREFYRFQRAGRVIRD